MRLPTTDEVKAILEASSGPFRAFVALAAFGGLRLGEVAALQVGDVDYLRGVVSVTRQVQRAGAGVVEVRAPKYGSERQVYVPRALTDLLAKHVAQYCPGDDPTRWMFEGMKGNPPHQNSIGHLWRKACREAKVDGVEGAKVEGVTLHDLRHYYASGLIAAGCDVVTVQRALGHSKATTTLNTYAHLWPTAEDRTRKAAASMMVEVLGVADSVRTEGTSTGP